MWETKSKVSFVPKQKFTRTVKALFLAAVISVALAFYAGYTVASNGNTFTISSGIYPGAASYTVYREGDTYYAKNAYGAIEFSGADAATVIQSAINAVSSGGKIFIKNGVYGSSPSFIDLNDNIVLEGESVTQTIFNSISFRILAKSNVTLRNFKLTGSPPQTTETKWASVLICDDSQHITVENVRAESVKSSVAVFQLFVANEKTINDIMLKDLVTVDSDGFGFRFDGDTIDGGVIQNVALINCEVYNAGLASTRSSDWVTGFDLTEKPHIKHVTVLNCKAENSWESGFHMEDAPTKDDVKFIACKSINNGQKPSRTYGAGFLVSGNTTLLNVYAEGNKKCNFRLRKGNIELIDARSKSAGANDIWAVGTVNAPLSIKIIGGWFEDCGAVYGGSTAIIVDGVVDSVIEGVTILRPGGTAIDISNSQNLKILNNVLLEINDDGVQWKYGIQYANAAPAYNVLIVGNYLQSNKTLDAGISLGSGGTNIICVYNNVINITGTKFYVAGEGKIVKYNLGFTTENSGTASGTSPITVAHGLAGTPTIVVVTPQGSTPCKVSWTADSTNIYIYHDAGTSITVSWYAEYKP